MLHYRCVNSVAVEDSAGKKNKSILLYTSGDVEYTAEDRKYQYRVVKDGCKVCSLLPYWRLVHACLLICNLAAG